MLKILRRLFFPQPDQLDAAPAVAPPVVVPPVAPPVVAPPVTPPTSVPAVAPPVAVPVAPQFGPTIAIVNATSVLQDAQFPPVLTALQTQIDRDFAPIWQTRGKLVFYPRSQITAIPRDCWVVLALDTSDQAGALGYHDITAAGMPVAKIFVRDDMKYGLSWTVTLSHELLEMLVDPYISTTVFAQNSNTTGTLYALEVADACEDDRFAYSIGDVQVSDFVTPAWFESFRQPNSTKFDFCGFIHQPWELLSGGYIGVFDVNQSAQGWHQLTAEAVPGRRLLHKSPMSRSHRRGKPLVV